MLLSLSLVLRMRLISTVLVKVSPAGHGSGRRLLYQRHRHSDPHARFFVLVVTLPKDTCDRCSHLPHSDTMKGTIYRVRSRLQSMHSQEFCSVHRDLHTFSSRTGEDRVQCIPPAKPGHKYFAFR